MTFIITLISLVIERFFHWNQVRQWRWFMRYQHGLSRSRINNWPFWLLIILSILPFMVIVGVINLILDNWLYGILKLLFGVAVLMYCLGPSNLWVQVFGCINELYKEDPTSAIERVNVSFGIGHPENSQAFHQAFTRAIFEAANRRVFAVVFWFVILGPVGAVMYRSIELMSSESPLGLSSLALRFLRILDWLPVRVLSIIFALMGHFTSVYALWKRKVFKGPETNTALLTDCGIAALAMQEGSLLPEDGSAEKETIHLLDRAFVTSLVILAIIVLIV